MNDAVVLPNVVGGVTVNEFGADALVVEPPDGEVVTGESEPETAPMLNSGAPMPTMMLPSASSDSAMNLCAPWPMMS